MVMVQGVLNDSDITKLASIPTGGVQGPQIWQATTPTTLVGDVNDYNPSPGLSSFSILRIDGGASNRTITGLVPANNSQICVIENVGATNSLILTHQDAASAAANRFVFAGSATATLPVGGAMILWYDPTTLRWRNVGRATGASAVTSSVTPADVANTAAIGSNGEASRADHVHDLPFATVNQSLSEATSTVTIPNSGAGVGLAVSASAAAAHGVTGQGGPSAGAGGSFIGGDGGPGVLGQGGTGTGHVGVYGAGTGLNAGVLGESSTGGQGVRGRSLGSSGVGGHFTGAGIDAGVTGTGGPSAGPGGSFTGGIGGTSHGVLGQGTGAGGVGVIGTAASAGNSEGVRGLGFGFGAGVNGTGGTTGGNGGTFSGGIVSGSGIGVVGTGGAPNGIGVRGQGTGSGNGVSGSADTTGIGVIGQGGATSGVGVQGTGGTGSVGVRGVGGSGGGNGVNGVSTGNSASGVDGNATAGIGGTGVVGTGGTVSGRGVQGNGGGSGTGVEGNGGTTGVGVKATGGATSGASLHVAIGNAGQASTKIDTQATPTLAHVIGNMYMDTVGLPQVCVAAGTPGTFVPVGGLVKTQFSEQTADLTVAFTAPPNWTEITALTQTFNKLDANSALVIHFDVSAETDTNGRNLYFRLNVDGTTYRGTSVLADNGRPGSGAFTKKITGLAAGNRTIKIEWEAENNFTGRILATTNPDWEHASLLTEEVRV